MMKHNNNQQQHTSNRLIWTSNKFIPLHSDCNSFFFLSCLALSFFRLDNSLAIWMKFLREHKTCHRIDWCVSKYENRLLRETRYSMLFISPDGYSIQPFNLHMFAYELYKRCIYVPIMFVIHLIFGFSACARTVVYYLAVAVARESEYIPHSLLPSSSISQSATYNKHLLTATVAFYLVS